jgi:predicted NBD/HSP70 family sugar kinase
MPGTVDLDEGTLIFAPNLQWRNVPLRTFFSEHTGLKVFIENDANAAAVAEHLFGAARQSQNFIFVFAGIGIGGGLFLDGNLYRGEVGYAGEIGHSPIMAEPFQSPCHCGNRGCWEAYANQYSIIRRVQARLEAKRSSIIPQLMEEQDAPMSLSIIKQAADAGDEEVIEALSETGTAMGIGFATLLNILNPEKIILGGPLSIVGNYLLPSAKNVATNHALPEMRPKVDILLSSFGKDASLIGAVSIVVDDILSNPTHIERR